MVIEGLYLEKEREKGDRERVIEIISFISLPIH